MDKIKFAFLNKDSFKVPTRKHSTDAGIDLYAEIINEFDSEYAYNGNERVRIEPFDSRIIHTNLTVEIPEGYFGWITNKSGNDFLIGGGIVDQGYHGELLVKIINYTPQVIYIEQHQDIAQLLIIPCKILDIEIADLSEIHQKKSERGASGGIVNQLKVGEIGDDTAPWWKDLVQSVNNVTNNPKDKYEIIY